MDDPEELEPSSPAARARLEEEEERRAAEHAAALAAQREANREAVVDPYVARRVQAEMNARAEIDRAALEEEERLAGGSVHNPWLLYLGISAVIAVLLLIVVGMMANRSSEPVPLPRSAPSAPQPGR